MNTKEQFVEKLIDATKNNEIEWISKNIDTYSQFLGNKNLTKIFQTLYRANTILLCEEVNSNSNFSNLNNVIYDYINDNTVFNMYIIKDNAIQTTISFYEVSRNLYLKMLKEIVDNYSDRYLSNLL